jgi:hypothetical protein
MKVYVLFSLLVICMSCKNFSGKQHEPLARVYNTYLYREDVAAIFPPDISEADSIKIARSYIDKWIRNQLFLRLAEVNLPAGEKNVEKQIASFRASLLIHKYHQFLINQKLDTVITFNEINDYYEDNKNNFILDKPAIRGIYLKIPLSAANRDRILTWFRNENDFMQIENYADQYAETYFWFNEDWVYLYDVLNNLPPGSINLSDNLSGRDNITVTDSEYHYFIGITEYLAPRRPMPENLASQKIKSIILNKRKIKFLNELEKSVLTEGSSKNSYQYF